jgi:hypothetical protein
MGPDGGRLRQVVQAEVGYVTRPHDEEKFGIFDEQYLQVPCICYSLAKDSVPFSVHSLSMTMAEAAPPPLHKAATPFCPGFKAWIRVTTIRHPEAPIG